MEEWVQFLGHATLWLRIKGLSLLTDPIAKVVWGNASLGRFFNEIEKSFPIDVVLISHTHRDHMDIPTLRKIKAKRVVLPKGTSRFLPLELMRSAIELGKWSSVRIGGVKVTAVPSKHLSWRSPYPFFLPALGFIVESGDLSFYFAGDTGFSERLFKVIGERFKIDVAFLPVGPALFFLRWYHLCARDAIRACDLLGAKVFVPIHWGVVKSMSGDSARTIKKILEISPPTLRLLHVGERVSWKELIEGERAGSEAAPALRSL